MVVAAAEAGVVDEGINPEATIPSLSLVLKAQFLQSRPDCPRRPFKSLRQLFQRLAILVQVYELSIFFIRPGSVSAFIFLA